MSMWREWPEYPDSRTTFKACKNSFLQAFTVLRSTSIPRIMPLRYRRLSYHQVCNVHSSPFPVPPQWHWHTSKFWVSRFFFFFFQISVWTCWNIHSTSIKSTSKQKTIYLTNKSWKDIYFRILTILHFQK